MFMLLLRDNMGHNPSSRKNISGGEETNVKLKLLGALHTKGVNFMHGLCNFMRTGV